MASFISQGTTTISPRPDVNIYLNFRIKSFKGFIRLENLKQCKSFKRLSFTQYNMLLRVIRQGIVASDRYLVEFL